MKIIEIKGKPGSGKSEILDYLLQKYKCNVYICNDIINSFLSKDGKCFNKIISILGPDNILNYKKEINKTKLREIINTDKEKGQKIEKIINSQVIDFLKENIKRDISYKLYDYCFIEESSLIKLDLKKIVNEIWFIQASKKQIVKKLKETKNYTDEKIEAIIESKPKDKEYIEMSDFIIKNYEDKTKVFNQIDDRLNQKKKIIITKKPDNQEILRNKTNNKKIYIITNNKINKNSNKNKNK